MPNFEYGDLEQMETQNEKRFDSLERVVFEKIVAVLLALTAVHACIAMFICHSRPVLILDKVRTLSLTLHSHSQPHVLLQVID